VSWPRKVPRPSAAQDGTDPVALRSQPLSLIRLFRSLSHRCRLPATAMVSTSQGISWLNHLPECILPRSSGVAYLLSARQQSWLGVIRNALPAERRGFQLEEATIADVHRAILARQLTGNAVGQYLPQAHRCPINGTCVKGAVDPRPAFSSATSSRSSTPASSTL